MEPVRSVESYRKEIEHLKKLVMKKDQEIIELKHKLAESRKFIDELFDDHSNHNSNQEMNDIILAQRLQKKYDKEKKILDLKEKYKKYIGLREKINSYHNNNNNNNNNNYNNNNNNNNYNYNNNNNQHQHHYYSNNHNNNDNNDNNNNNNNNNDNINNYRDMNNNRNHRIYSSNNHRNIELLQLNYRVDSERNELNEPKINIKRKMSQNEINRLGTEKYDSHNHYSTKQCTFCLNEFKDGDILRRLNCLHIFHKNCIDPWLKKNGLCPIDKVCVELI